jgi:hypothetical protein
MDKSLNLMVPLGSPDGCVDLKGLGNSGRVQRLWKRYCGIHLRIDKLAAALDKIKREILQEDPSFFEPKYSLSGSNSFPFQPELRAAKKHRTEVALRNAIILRNSSLNTYQSCWILDAEKRPVPKNWKKDFPQIRTWVDAHREARCRPRVEKLISEARAPGHLL